MKKKLFALILFPLFLLAYGLSTLSEGRGFTLGKIAHALPLQQETSVFPSELFSQKFHYLKGGTQCFTFISDDQKYVLKFFKKKFKTTEFKDTAESTFTSFQLAYDELKDESGLIYLHLTKTDHLKKTVFVTNKYGRDFQVNLDNFAFVVQKKADLLSTKLAEWGEGDMREKAIAGVLAIVKKRCEKGLLDRDGDVGKNYGFLGDGQPIYIDTGRLARDDSLKDPHNAQKELDRVRLKLQDIR